MSRFVPYLAEETIERDAAALLAEFEHARGLTLEPPIPVEDIEDTTPECVAGPSPFSVGRC